MCNNKSLHPDTFAAHLKESSTLDFLNESEAFQTLVHEKCWIEGAEIPKDASEENLVLFLLRCFSVHAVDIFKVCALKLCFVWIPDGSYTGTVCDVSARRRKKLFGWTTVFLSHRSTLESCKYSHGEWILCLFLQELHLCLNM